MRDLGHPLARSRSIRERRLEDALGIVLVSGSGRAVPDEDGELRSILDRHLQNAQVAS